MDKQIYRVTRPDIEWIAGRRVQDGKIALTEAEAEHDLARENIELDVEDAGASLPVAVDEAGQTGGKARKAREA